MQNISFIKTREDALSAIDAVAVPVADEKASETHKANTAREAVFVTSIKEFLKTRIAAVPDAVKVIGVEVRGDTDGMELFQYRIIHHK